MTKRRSAGTPKKGSSSKQERAGVSIDGLREMLHALPGVEEGVSYGTTGWKVKTKFLARIKEDGETLALRIPFEVRDLLLEADPDVYFTTPHYDGYPAILVRLPKVRRSELATILETAWRDRAPKRLLEQFDADAAKP